MRTMTTRHRAMGKGLFLVLILLSVSLAGCAGARSAAGPHSTPTPTPALIPTVISVPTIAEPTNTPTPPPLVTSTCPTMLSPDGSTKIYTDPRFGFSFTYPAAWTENTCQSGPEFVIVGNLFIVSVTPRQGRTIAQWVAATKTPEETVTLTPIADPHAVEVAQVSVTFPNGAVLSTPQPFQPFVQAFAIVAGTQSFYNLHGSQGQVSMTDTMPPLSDVQVAQQIVSTFNVS